MNLLDLARSALVDGAADEHPLGGPSPAPSDPIDPGTARRRAKVLAMLAADPKLQLAVVADTSADPVVVAIARRSYVGEIEIPATYYDPITLMGLLDRHSEADT